MRIQENHPLGSQLFHMRRFGLGIALQNASPVIEIVDGNEQDIWFSDPANGVVSLTGLADDAKQENGQREYR